MGFGRGRLVTLEVRSPDGATIRTADHDRGGERHWWPCSESAPSGWRTCGGRWQRCPPPRPSGGRISTRSTRAARADPPTPPGGRARGPPSSPSIVGPADFTPSRPDLVFRIVPLGLSGARAPRAVPPQSAGDRHDLVRPADARRPEAQPLLDERGRHPRSDARRMDCCRHRDGGAVLVLLALALLGRAAALYIDTAGATAGTCPRLETLATDGYALCHPTVEATRSHCRRRPLSLLARRIRATAAIGHRCLRGHRGRRTRRRVLGGACDRPRHARRPTSRARWGGAASAPGRAGI
jgi:hypothetical protein